MKVSAGSGDRDRDRGSCSLTQFATVTVTGAGGTGPGPGPVTLSGPAPGLSATVTEPGPALALPQRVLLVLWPGGRAAAQAPLGPGPPAGPAGACGVSLPVTARSQWQASWPGVPSLARDTVTVTHGCQCPFRGRVAINCKSTVAVNRGHRRGRGAASASAGPAWGGGRPGVSASVGPIPTRSGLVTVMVQARLPPSGGCDRPGLSVCRPGAVAATTPNAAAAP